MMSINEFRAWLEERSCKADSVVRYLDPGAHTSDHHEAVKAANRYRAAGRSLEWWLSEHDGHEVGDFLDWLTDRATIDPRYLAIWRATFTVIQEWEKGKA